LNNGFARSVGVLVGGTAGAQILMLLAAPVLTRLYGTESFGVLAVYIGLISLFSVVASLRYELAIPLPESERDAAALTLLSMITVALVSVAAAVIVWVLGDGLAVLLGVPALAEFIWLVPVGVLLTGGFQVLSYRAVRTKAFPLLAKVKIRQQLVMALIQIGIFKFGSVGLMLGQALGQGVGGRLLAGKLIAKGEWRAIPPGDMWNMAKRYRRFPLYSTWAGLLNTAGFQVPPLLLASFFGASSAGLYALAHRVVALPMAVVGKAVSQVFFSDAAIDYRNGELPGLALRTQRMLIRIILPPVIFLILFAPPIFALVFGDDWIGAGEVAAWLALWMLVSFATSPLSTLFAVAERQSLGLSMQAVLFLVRMAGIGVGVYHQDFMLGVIGFALSNVVGYLVYQTVAFASIGLRVSQSLLGYALAAPPVVLAFLFKDNLAGSGLVTVFVILLVVSAVHYYWVIKSLRDV
tara:strand:+ start:38976 stop:40370 length:1395 start_codon:yes stop_codon:yes gene_type:complete